MLSSSVMWVLTGILGQGIKFFGRHNANPACCYNTKDTHDVRNSEYSYHGNLTQVPWRNSVSTSKQVDKLVNPGKAESLGSHFSRHYVICQSLGCDVIQSQYIRVPSILVCFEMLRYAVCLYALICHVKLLVMLCCVMLRVTFARLNEWLTTWMNVCVHVYVSK